MKIKITFKDPDSLQDQVEEAIKEELETKTDLSEDEKDVLLEKRKEKVLELCSKWFEYGEYLRVEVDTEKETCIVEENN